MPASRMRQVSDAPSSYFDVCAATAAVYPTPRRLLLPGCFAGLLAAPYAGVSRIVGQQAEALLALRVAPAPLLPQSSFTHEMVVVRASKPLAPRRRATARALAAGWRRKCDLCVRTSHGRLILPHKSCLLYTSPSPRDG